MTGFVLPRRHFLAGLVGLVAAPMVVHAAALMPVKVERSFAYFRGIPIYADPRLSGDIVTSVFNIPMFKDYWPSSMVTMIRHRRDLSDLGEPYLSMVKAQRGG